MIFLFPCWCSAMATRFNGNSAVHPRAAVVDAGITLRNYAAVQIMAALIGANSTRPINDPEIMLRALAKLAFQAADAMAENDK